MSRVGDSLIKLRKAKDMTQKQLGKLIGVSDSFIDEVESGKRVMKDDMLLRITKALGQTSVKTEMYDASDMIKRDTIVKAPAVSAPKQVQQVWVDALEGILKAVPVYDYKMDKAIATKQLPIIANKVEGFAKDKVFYLRVEDNDMIGFRIMKGDLALANMTQEFEKDAMYFIEYNEKRAIRQVKKLEGNKLLLINNKGSLVTETIGQKNVKILARFIRLEILL